SESRSRAWTTPSHTNWIRQELSLLARRRKFVAPPCDEGEKSTSASRHSSILECRAHHSTTLRVCPNPFIRREPTITDSPASDRRVLSIFSLPSRRARPALFSRPTASVWP